MNTYEFRIIIGGEDCGTITQEGNTEQEAFDIVSDDIGNAISMLPVYVSYNISVA